MMTLSILLFCVFVCIFGMVYVIFPMVPVVRGLRSEFYFSPTGHTSGIRWCIHEYSLDALPSGARILVIKASPLIGTGEKKK